MATAYNLHGTKLYRQIKPLSWDVIGTGKNYPEKCLRYPWEQAQFVSQAWHPDSQRWEPVDKDAVQEFVDRHKFSDSRHTVKGQRTICTADHPDADGNTSKCGCYIDIVYGVWE